jgi:hypothetical protein
MKQRWIFVTLFVILIGGLTAAVIFGPRGDWGDRHDRAEVVRVVDEDGNTVADTGNTIIIERGHGFFPFGIFLIPLFFILIFGLFRRAWWGGRGNGYHGGPPSSQWLDDWHRRQHQDKESQAQDTQSQANDPDRPEA